MTDDITIVQDMRLKPPRNLRGIQPQRCCETCGLLTTDGAATYCTRPGGPIFETGMREESFTVCDGWRGIR